MRSTAVLSVATCIGFTSAALAGPPVLYENGPLVTHPAVGCDPGDGQGPRDTSQVQEQFGNVFTGLAVGSNFPARICDDFYVCDEATLNQMMFHIWQSGVATTCDTAGEIVTITGMTVEIWNGRPDDVGSSVVWGDQVTNVLSGANFSFTYKTGNDPPEDIEVGTRPLQECWVTVDPPLVLPPGQYWISYDATGDGINGGPWIPPVSDPAQAATGNSRQFFGGGWSNNVGDNTGLNNRVGAPFVLYGTGGICDACGGGGTPCPCDFDGNGNVDVDDLLVVLGNWGGAGGDCTGDGTTDVNDLLAILAGWGDCPPGPSGYTPENDDQANALAINGDGLQSYDLQCATQDGSASCATGPDLWYSYTPTETQSKGVVSNNDADFIAVYDAGGEIACGMGQVSFPATAGTTYTVQVIQGTPFIQTADTELSFQLAPPSNDECAGATEIFAGDTAYDTTGSTTSTTPPDENLECDQGSGTLISNDIWHTYIATDTGFLTISNCAQPGVNDCPGSPAFDTDLMCYDSCGNCVNPVILGCNDDYADHECGGDPFWNSQFTVPVIAGNCYTIRNGGWQQASDFGAGVLCLDLVPGPINDVCAGATAMSIGDTISQDITGLGVDSSPACIDVPAGPGVWYKVVGDGTTLTAATCGTATAIDTYISVYTGDCLSLVCVAGNDDDITCFFGESSVSWCSADNTEYLILVRGAGPADEGVVEMTVSSDNVSCD